MALGYKEDAIAQHGGENGIEVKNVNADGSDLGSPDSFTPLGYLEDATPKDDTPKTKKSDETGSIVKVLEGIREVGLDAILMQSGADEMNFLVKDSRGKFYAVYRDNGIVDNKHQEIFYAICMIANKYDVKSTDKVIPITVDVLKNKSAITITAANLPTSAHTSSDVTIPAGEYYKIVETAVS